MNTRITFGTNQKQFNGLSKKAYADLSQDNDHVSNLTLNQFRELSARFFGYNSKHEVAQSGSVSKNQHITELSHVDELHLRDLLIRIDDIWPSDPLSRKAPFDTLPTDVWDYIAEKYTTLFHEFVIPQRHFIALPIISNALTNIPSWLDIKNTTAAITKAIGLDVTYLPNYTQNHPFPLYENEQHREDFLPVFKKREGDIDTDTFINYQPLDLALEITYLWFECEFDGTEDNFFEIERLLEKGAKNIVAAINSEPNDLLISLPYTFLFNANEVVGQSDIYFFNRDELTLKSLNETSANPKSEKYISLINHDVCAGYVTLNDNDIRIYLPTFDKLKFSLDDRDYLFTSVRNIFEPVIKGYDKPSFYDMAESAMEDDDGSYFWWDGFGESILTTEFFHSFVPVSEKLSRNSSLLGGNVIANPRYFITEKLLSEPELWDEIDESKDDLNYYHVRCRSYPTATACQNKDGYFALQTHADALSKKEASHLIITKIIRHSDGNTGMIIANVYNDDSDMIASESFSIYNLNPKSPLAGHNNCPIEEALHKIAEEQSWEVSIVECEYEWFRRELSGIEIFSGVPPHEVRKMNTRSGSITILTNEQTTDALKSHLSEVTNAVKQVIQKFGPHRASDGASLIDVDIQIEPALFHILPILYTGADILDEFLNKNLERIKNDEVSNIYLAHSALLKHHSGSVTFFFTMKGSTTNLNEAFSSCSNMFMPSEIIEAFGGKPDKETIPGEVGGSDYALERDTILHLFGINDVESKVVLRLHK